MSDSPAHPVPRAEPTAARRATVAPATASGAVAQVLDPSLGVSTTYHYRQNVAEVLHPSDYPRLTSLVRTLAPGSGTVREFGGGLLWEEDTGYSTLSLTIAPEPSATVIRADLRLEVRKFTYYAGGVASALVTGLLATKFLPPLQATLVAAAALGPFALASRALWNASARRSAVALHNLVDKIAAALRGELD